MKYILPVVFTLVAAITDLKGRRVPNFWILTGLCLAFGQSIIAGPGIKSSLTGVAFALPLLLFYAFRMLGAGDVKLIMVLGVFLGAPALGDCLFFILICTLLQFFVFSVIDNFIKDKERKLIRVRGSSHYMPMAPAIFGGVVVMILKSWF